ncbi:extracellular solute-binding protein [Paenibacillus humicola]|uniref:extracellular solute-binding protein n=1 Tax=Paenibacillus humicola TaxID=3110540 RepID=UPI00237A989D|nr:extracellular solute-binding protein [Paenibacillus humicola]
MRNKQGIIKTVVIMLSLLVIVAGCAPAPKKAGNTGSAGDTGGSGTGASTGGTAADPNALDWSKTDDPALKNEQLTILVADNDGTVAKMLERFTDQTGIKLNVIGVDYNSLYTKITTAALANSSDIDLAEMDTIWAGQFLEGNIVEDLTNVVPADVQKGFTPSSLSSVKYNNKLAAMPYFSSTKHFYWNTDLLKKAGITSPPKTWDEFRADSKKLTKAGLYASGWSWKQAEGLICDFVGMVYSFGGSFFTQDGKLNVNDAGAVKALQYMSDLINVDKTVDPASLQWSEDDVRKAFAAGKIAMMSNWEGTLPVLNDPSQSKVVGQTEVGLLPGEGSVVSAAVTGSEGIAIMKSSKHKEAALAFLKWMASKDFQEPNFVERGVYPVLQSLYDDPKVKEADKDHTIDKILEQFQYGENRPNGPGYVEWADILSGELFNALAGHKDPKTALDDAAKKIDDAIKKAEAA